MKTVLDFLILHAGNPKVWASIVAMVLGITGYQATTIQTEQLIAGITALMAFILPFLHSPAPKE